MGPEDPLKDTEGAGRSVCQVTFKNLLSVLANKKVPDVWRLANVMPIYRKSRKEDPWNDRPVSLASVPEKIREITWTAITMAYTGQAGGQTHPEQVYRRQALPD